MSFFSATIPEQVEVIKAIDKLMEISGFDMVKRTYAQAIYQDLKRGWAESLGLKQFTGRPCVHKLLGQKCLGGESFSLIPPYTDHPSLWLKDGKPFCLVSQPYGLSMLQIEEIGEFCHKHGLEFEINSWPGWHFPHAVLFITFTPAPATCS